MITEQFVFFEVAKLLKEKGFDEPCRTYYQDERFVDDVCTKYYQWNSRSPFGHISASTLQMAMKWLREVHELAVEPYYYFPLGWCVDIKHINRKTDVSEFEEIRGESYETYEAACEAAIKYCLENLITT